MGIIMITTFVVCHTLSLMGASATIYEYQSDKLMQPAVNLCLIINSSCCERLTDNSVLKGLLVSL